MNKSAAIGITDRRRSLIWKPTLFVCASVIMTAGLLGWAGYRFTRRVLVDQIQDRLSIVAEMRQKTVLTYVEQCPVVEADIANLSKEIVQLAVGAVPRWVNFGVGSFFLAAHYFDNCRSIQRGQKKIPDPVLLPATVGWDEGGRLVLDFLPRRA